MENQSVYRQIFNDLLKKISSGKIKAGARLPSEAELCEVYKVSRITSKRALDLLAEQGYIYRLPGKGSFVNDNSRNQEGKKGSLLGTIGLVIPDFSDSFGTKLICGIEESCSALGYQLVLKRTRDQAKVEEEAIHSLSTAAGILLLPIHGDFYNSEILKLILDNRALVFVDRKLRGLAAPTVSSDNVKAAEEGTEYLLNLGHRNIAFFSGLVNHTSTVEDRYQGFIQGFSKFGISYDPAYICQDLSSIWTWPFYSSERISADIEIAAKLLNSCPEISAVFAAEYSMALIVKAAAESLGRHIPNDLSIITFDSPPAITGSPFITHLLQDEYSIGEKAVQTLHQIISRKETVPTEDILIPTKLIIGTSTGPKETN